MASKPRVRVYFWDQITNECSKKVVLRPGITTLGFLFRNEGDFLRLRNPAATMLTAFLYFPKDFEIIEARRFETPLTRSRDYFLASPSGRFAGMKYIAVPSVYEIKPPAISILSYKEDVICEVDIRVPNAVVNKKFEIYCQITSREGDLGVHTLNVEIKKNDKESK
jgi:hypothetical protein